MYGCREVNRTVDNYVVYSGGLCAECEETFYSAYTACEECADDARRCVDTAETLL